MMQDSQPLSSFSARRGGDELVGNEGNSFSTLLRENAEAKFTGCRNPELEFQCASGNECIPIYDTCNGIPQCQDGSDENPSECPATTKSISVTRIPKIRGKSYKKKVNGTVGEAGNRASLPKRPGDVNRWGREGEKYRPGITGNTDNNVNQQQTEDVQGQTSFRHRGDPVGQQNFQQIPGILQQNGIQQSQLQQPIYNQIQQQPLAPYNINGPQIGPRYDYMNPNLANYGYGNINPNYGYSPLNQQGYYPVSSYVNGGLDNRRIQPQQPGDVGISQPQAGDILNNIQDNSEKIKAQNKNEKSDKTKSGKKKAKSSNNKTAKSKLASKILSSKTGNTKSSEENDEGRNTDSVIIDNSNVFVDTIKDTILKDLKDADFVMETPSAAIFTLVVGVSLSLVTCLALFCRCRSLRRKGRKRNLASDADGDYLVNGMYL